jgi:hypothetical protein
MYRRTLRIALILCVLSVGEVFAGDSTIFGMDASISHVAAAAVSGYAQTPAGGRPETSSPQGPTLEQMGVGGIEFYNLALSAQDGQNEFYVGGNVIHMKGDSVLDLPLTTHGASFPAGTDFHSTLGDDWYQAGYARWYGSTDGKFKGAPVGELALFRYDYKFHADGISDGRAYAKLSPRVGAKGEFAITRNAALLGSAAATVPVGRSPQIITADVKLRQTIFETTSKSTGALFAGIGAMNIDYKDGQTMPNHVRFHAEPFITVGFSARM